MGLLSLANHVTWSLSSMDFPGLEYTGDFPPIEVTENISGSWAEQKTLGLIQPILQFTGGNLETIEISIKVWAKHQGILGTGLLTDDIETRVEQIKDLPRPFPGLNRPQVWLFAMVPKSSFLSAVISQAINLKGPTPQLSQQVVVTSVGGIKYDPFRGDGSLRGATFDISMSRYEPFDINNTATEAESLVTPAITGETYEHVAKRVHGDPNLGEALRRRNPDKLILREGDLVHVPSAKILRRESLPLTPQSLPLKNGDSQRQNILAAFQDRGGPQYTHVLKKDWGS
jgi:hypothetical protein